MLSSLNWRKNSNIFTVRCFFRTQLTDKKQRIMQDLCIYRHATIYATRVGTFTQKSIVLLAKMSNIAILLCNIISRGTSICHGDVDTAAKPI